MISANRFTFIQIVSKCKKKSRVLIMVTKLFNGVTK